MIRKRRWTIAGIALGIYLLALGFLGGLMAERIRFDNERRVILHRYEEAVRKWQAYLIKVEQRTMAERSSVVHRTPGGEK